MTNMDATPDFERLVSSWLASDGPSDVRQEVVDRAIDTSLRVRPRSGVAAWLAGVRPWPGRRRAGVLVTSRSVVIVGLAIALLLALVALAIGTRPPRPSLLGEISTTGPMAADVWAPVTEVLADGSVLVVGPIPNMWLHAEIWDPATEAFSVVDDLPSTLSLPGFFGSVLLGDGDVLLIVRRYASSMGEYPGFASRFDPEDRVFRRAGGFTPGDVPGDVADFGFANWPATVGQDGTVRWTPPPSRVDEPTVTYDPSADAFSLEHPTAGGTAEFRPSDEFSLGSVDLGAGRRHLWLESGADSGVTATVVDSSGKVESRYEWPLVRSGHYEGAVLPDGRVLLVGASTALVDPATGAFEEVDLPVGFAIEARWLHGRILLAGFEPAPAGENADSATGLREARAWMFDPLGDKFSMLSDTPLPGAATWTVLDDGRVLIVSEDNGGNGPIEPTAFVIR